MRESKKDKWIKEELLKRKESYVGVVQDFLYDYYEKVREAMPVSFFMKPEIFDLQSLSSKNENNGQTEIKNYRILYSLKATNDDGELEEVDNNVLPEIITTVNISFLDEHIIKKTTICQINHRECNIYIDLPPYFESLESYIKYALSEAEPFDLSEKSKKSLTEFCTFKYYSSIVQSEHKEIYDTYYNMLIYGKEQQGVDSFVSVLKKILQVSDNKVENVSERIIDDEKYISPFSGDLGKSLEDKKLICINECREKPYENPNFGTGGAIEKQRKRAKMYKDFWKEAADYSKKNPSITMVVSMDELVYKVSFSKDNELNHRIFGHRIEIPEFNIERVVSFCINEFRQSSIEASKDFEEELEKYIRTIYRRADLSGMVFANDLVNRVYSYYFRKKRKKPLLTPDCIPPYEKDTVSVERIMSELDDLIGLKEVKKTLKKIYMEQVANPQKTKDKSFHMVFYGNPGTGKTTVARLVANILCKAGVIGTNKCVETSATDLISGYRGVTGEKTRKKIEEALDGVLFIDEAYGLKDSEHGQEAITELIKKMLDYKDRLVVILAGYEKEMDDLIKSNPGFPSRLPYKLQFADYDMGELKQIFDLRCTEHGFKIDGSAEHLLDETLQARRLQDFFGNAREVENILNELESNWSAEAYELKKADTHNVHPKIFYERHFVGLVPEKNPLSIDKLIGLETVKKQMEKFRSQVRYVHYLRESGMKNIPDSFMHMLYIGNPGTGKTTVAKLVANDLYSLGVLKTNKLVIAERKDIESKHLGGTSEKMAELVHKAIGGVLFIDEAYALADDERTGREAVEVLITAMVEHREDTIFIFAGYPREMQRFLNLNPGILSRIGYTFVFEDYTTDELMEIFGKQMAEDGFCKKEDVEPKVRDLMEYFREMPRFGNGRFVEKVISRIINNRAERDYDDGKDFNCIEGQDVPEISDLIETNQFGLRLHDPKKITEADRLRTAYHELGHAIAIYELNPDLEIEKVSVINRAFSLGKVSIKPRERNLTEDELKNEIAINLAGRSAERVFLGSCDTGCIYDYENSKKIAEDMINSYGMCEIGITRVEELLRQGDKDATKVIQKYQRCIEAIAVELLQGREFTGEEFKKRVDEFMKNS